MEPGPKAVQGLTFDEFLEEQMPRIRATAYRLATAWYVDPEDLIQRGRIEAWRAWERGDSSVHVYRRMIDDIRGLSPVANTRTSWESWGIRAAGDEFRAADDREHARRLLSVLDERKRYVVRRFLAGATDREIANEMGLTKTSPGYHRLTAIAQMARLGSRRV